MGDAGACQFCGAQPRTPSLAHVGACCGTCANQIARRTGRCLSCRIFQSRGKETLRPHLSADDPGDFVFPYCSEACRERCRLCDNPKVGVQVLPGGRDGDALWCQELCQQHADEHGAAEAALGIAVPDDAGCMHGVPDADGAPTGRLCGRPRLYRMSVCQEHFDPATMEATPGPSGTEDMFPVGAIVVAALDADLALVGVEPRPVGDDEDADDARALHLFGILNEMAALPPVLAATGGAGGGAEPWPLFGTVRPVVVAGGTKKKKTRKPKRKREEEGEAGASSSSSSSEEEEEDLLDLGAAAEAAALVAEDDDQAKAAARPHATKRAEPRGAASVATKTDDDGRKRRRKQRRPLTLDEILHLVDERRTEAETQAAQISAGWEREDRERRDAADAAQRKEDEEEEEKRRQLLRDEEMEEDREKGDPTEKEARLAEEKKIRANARRMRALQQQRRLRDAQRRMWQNANLVVDAMQFLTHQRDDSTRSRVADWFKRWASTGAARKPAKMFAGRNADPLLRVMGTVLLPSVHAAELEAVVQEEEEAASAQEAAAAEASLGAVATSAQGRGLVGRLVDGLRGGWWWSRGKKEDAGRTTKPTAADTTTTTPPAPPTPAAAAAEKKKKAAPPDPKRRQEEEQARVHLAGRTAAGLWWAVRGASDALCVQGGLAMQADGHQLVVDTVMANLAGHGVRSSEDKKGFGSTGTSLAVVSLSLDDMGATGEAADEDDDVLQSIREDLGQWRRAARPTEFSIVFRPLRLRPVFRGVSTFTAWRSDVRARRFTPSALQILPNDIRMKNGLTCAGIGAMFRSLFGPAVGAPADMGLKAVTEHEMKRLVGRRVSLALAEVGESRGFPQPLGDLQMAAARNSQPWTTAEEFVPVQTIADAAERQKRVAGLDRRLADNLCDFFSGARLWRQTNVCDDGSTALGIKDVRFRDLGTRLLVLNLAVLWPASMAADAPADAAAHTARLLALDELLREVMGDADDAHRSGVGGRDKFLADEVVVYGDFGGVSLSGWPGEAFFRHVRPEGGTGATTDFLVWTRLGDKDVDAGRSVTRRMAAGLLQESKALQLAPSTVAGALDLSARVIQTIAGLTEKTNEAPVDPAVHVVHWYGTESATDEFAEGIPVEQIATMEIVHATALRMPIATPFTKLTGAEKAPVPMDASS